MKPSLLILSFSDIANDARVLKQVREFSSRYRVTTCGFGQQPHPGVEHLEVDAGAPTHTNSLLRQLREVGTIAARVTGWHHRIYNDTGYVLQARRMLRGRRFDLVLANDVDTIDVGLRSAGPAGVHADLHEFFPGLHSDSSRQGRKATAYMEWLVRSFATRAASVTTVSQGIVEAYREYGISAQVVTNASPRADYTPGIVSSPIRLVHSGNAQPSRQLEIIMRAVSESSANVTLDLLLMPNDVLYLEQLSALSMQLDSRVRILEPVPQSELIGVLNSYDVGVHVLPPTSFNNANALPNKFFDYVQARLGLIIGPSVEMVRLLEEYGVGAVTRDFTVAAVRDVLDTLTPQLVTQWKQQSQVASEPLGADAQIATWVAAIENLEAKI